MVGCSLLKEPDFEEMETEVLAGLDFTVMLLLLLLLPNLIRVRAPWSKETMQYPTILLVRSVGEPTKENVSQGQTHASDVASRATKPKTVGVEVTDLKLKEPKVGKHKVEANELTGSMPCMGGKRWKVHLM